MSRDLCGDEADSHARGCQPSYLYALPALDGDVSQPRVGVLGRQPATVLRAHLLMS